MPNTLPTSVSFQRKDSGVYGDEVVSLVDETHAALILKLYEAFARFQTSGAIREPLKEKLTDTLYEEDYQQANARLVGKTWKTMDLDTAAFLIGFHGCLGVNESLAILPFQFEILLRAESWVWPFVLLITSFRRAKKVPSSFEAAYDDTVLRHLVHEALQHVEAKYVNDANFLSSESAASLPRVIRDWT